MWYIAFSLRLRNGMGAFVASWCGLRSSKKAFCIFMFLFSILKQQTLVMCSLTMHMKIPHMNRWEAAPKNYSLGIGFNVFLLGLTSTSPIHDICILSLFFCYLPHDIHSIPRLLSSSTWLWPLSGYQWHHSHKSHSPCQPEDMKTE